MDLTQALTFGGQNHSVVAIGENHGHLELHALLLETLAEPALVGVFDDVIVEWGNALYQGEIDAYIAGGDVPWDSVAMAWRNTVVSPNTVWDSEVYANFFRGIRTINSTRPADKQMRVLLADSPVPWDQVAERADLAPYFDRAASMAKVIREESLLRGRRSLFLAGGLHVSKRPRTHHRPDGISVGEATPIAWVEFRNPGSTFVIQSFGRAAELGLSALIGEGPASVVMLADNPLLAGIPATRTSTLSNRDGSKPDVYPGLVLGQIIDAALVWDPGQVTLQDATPDAFRDDSYWAELNRRSQILRGQPMDDGLRTGGDH